MIPRLKRRKSGEQPPAKNQNEAATPPLPPKKRKEKTSATPKKKNSEKAVLSADSPVQEDVVNGLLGTEQYFPVRKDPILEKRTPNVEQGESDQEECSARSKRTKPEGRAGNREKGKSKKTKMGENSKTSDKGWERDEAVNPPSQVSPREEDVNNMGRERDEAVNPLAQLSPREEDGLPISNDGELEIVRLNSGENVVTISNEQETEPEFSESVAEEGCQPQPSATQFFSGSSPGASGSGLGGVVDPDSCTEKKMVHFNDKGQPIGEGSTSFTNELGSIARKHCPISYDQWRNVPDQTRDMIWKLVTDTYIIPVAYKTKILHKILSSWKKFKSLLRSKHYDAYDTDEERKRNCPKGVRQELWDIFVDNQSTPIQQARRRAGKLARDAMKTPHTSGRTGAARTAEALKKGNPFATVTRTDLYLAMHSRKDGSCPTPELTDKVEQIKAIAKQDPSSVNLDVDNDPVGQVLGPEKKGFVRGMGSVSKTELLLSGPVIDKLQQERRMRLSAEEQIADLREQLVSQASDPAGYQLEEERRLRVCAEEQIAVLKRQVVSQMDQIDQLKQERTLRLAAEAQITGLKEQITCQGEMITDMKQLIKRLC